MKYGSENRMSLKTKGQDVIKNRQDVINNWMLLKNRDYVPQTRYISSGKKELKGKKSGGARKRRAKMRAKEKTRVKEKGGGR